MKYIKLWKKSDSVDRKKLQVTLKENQTHSEWIEFNCDQCLEQFKIDTLNLFELDHHRRQLSDSQELVVFGGYMRESFLGLQLDKKSKKEAEKSINNLGVNKVNITSNPIKNLKPTPSLLNCLTKDKNKQFKDLNKMKNVKKGSIKIRSKKISVS